MGGHTDEKSFCVRTMTAEDYEGLRALWMSIRGFAIRSIDDSREGVERFLRRNPSTSVALHRWAFKGSSSEELVLD